MGSTPAKEDVDRRRIRKHVWAQPQSIELRFPSGFQTEVEAELGRVLSTPVQSYPQSPTVERRADAVIVGGISFRQIFEVVFRMRTIRDVLWLLDEGKVSGYAELKRFLPRIPWNLILPKEASIALRVRSQASRLFHESGIRETIAGYLSGLRYRTASNDSAQMIVECTFVENRIRVLLSCGGGSSYERGYKSALRAIAPLREDLAACLFERLRILRPESLDVRRIVIPFAGSGTLAVESLLAAFDLPSGMFGRHYPLEFLPCATEQSNNLVRARSLSLLDTLRPNKRFVLAIEIDPEQAATAKENLDFAFSKILSHLPESIEWNVLVADALRTKMPSESTLVALNPPFGHRMSGERNLYRRIGRWLTENTESRPTGFVLSPSPREEEALHSSISGQALQTCTLRSGGLKIRATYL